MKFRIDSKNHELINAPVFFEAQADLSNSFLVGNDKKIPLAKSHGAKDQYVFVMDYMAQGTVEQYEIVEEKNVDTGENKYMEAVLGDGIVDIFSGGERICGYYFGSDLPKPYLGPFLAKNGECITRHDYAGNEHPHHRNIWFSHGDINGADTWNESEDNCGYIINQKIESIQNNQVFASFVAKNTWTSRKKEPIADDTTKITVYNTKNFTKIIDASLTLTASYGDITLGQTKEAGPIAVRMADKLRVLGGSGTIKSSYGAVNEAEIWMKRAGFNDYFGELGDNNVYGVAIFDNPENDGYPSYWHTRDYGLMAANNYYIGGEMKIKAGESVTFVYRIVVHEGDTESAKINTLFNNYLTSPEVVLG